MPITSNCCSRHQPQFDIRVQCQFEVWKATNGMEVSTHNSSAPKGGDSEVDGNYSPVSVLPVVVKVSSDWLISSYIFAPSGEQSLAHCPVWI